MMKTILIELSELIGDSTVHGIPKILKSKSIFMKTVWLLFTAASLYFCTKQIMKSIEDYLSYGTVTTFENKVEMPAEFPAITLCNLNAFQSDFALNMLGQIKSLFPPNVVLDKIEERLLYLSFVSSRFNDTTKKLISFSMKETLISCRFNGQPCYSNDFDWYFDPFYANCYRFNSRKGQIRNVTQTGNAFGLRLELFVGDEYKTQSFIRTAGYQVMINNQSNFPTANEGYTVSPGMETNLEISRVFNKKLGPLYNNCIQKSTYPGDTTIDSYLYQTIIKSNQSYRQVDCFKLCLQQEIIKMCECYSNQFERLNGTVICSIEKYACMMNIMQEFLSGDVVKLCSPYCPAECDSQTFSVSISSSVYPVYAYALELMNNSLIYSKLSKEELLPEKVRTSVLSVNVYYKDLSYTVIGQQAKTEIVDLISNVGGNLGVFIGMSLLSLVEILEILFVLLSSLFQISRTYNLNNKSVN